MKQIRSLISKLAAGSVVLAMATTLAAQTAQEGFAKVVNIKGAARCMVAGSTVWQPLKLGAILKPGTVVQTATDSYVDMVLNSRTATESLGSAGLSAPADDADSTAAPGADVPSNLPKAQQDAIRIFETSVLSIDKLTVTATGADTVTDTQLDLKAGRIFGTVKKLSAASKYEIKLPNGVAGIRGTIYLIGANGVLNVLSGSVVVSYVGASGAVVTQVVKAGQQFDPRVADPTKQVSPITNPVMKEMVKLAKLIEKFVHVNMPPVTYNVDHTPIYVSPTK
jgi:hypothetical protein